MSIKMNAKTIGLVFLCLIAAPLVVLPVAAQADDDQELVVVEGIFTVAADGTITVDDYVIAPANAFLPPDILEGDAVLITGYLLPDGLTVQALSIEIEPDAPATDSDETSPTSDQPGNITTDTTSLGNSGSHGNGNGHGNGQGHGNGHGNSNEHGNGQGNGRGNGHGNEDENSPERGFFCQNTTSQHPAAERIAAEFDVPYIEVITLFCQGRHGFGEIVIAYRLSEASGQNVSAIFALRDAGEGWGRIMRDLDINPGDVMGHRNQHGNPSGNGEGS